ncbi:MAG: hypothetical protein R3C26_01900 [Calditrichia bacterium]
MTIELLGKSARRNRWSAQTLSALGKDANLWLLLAQGAAAKD